MTCTCNAGVHSHQITAAAPETCPCGKKPADQCSGGCGNVTAAVEGEEATAVDAEEQPKLPTESHNDVITAMSRGMEDISSRMSGIEELLAQMLAARAAEKLAN